MLPIKFEHLEVSGHWEQYWSRYPQGYTILESLIAWTSQVDKMVDNQNDLNIYVTGSVDSQNNKITVFIKNTDDRIDIFMVNADNTISTYKTAMDNKIDNYQNWVMANSVSILPYLTKNGEAWEV